MHNRLLPDRSHMEEFLNGINQFHKFARRQIDILNGKKYRYSCANAGIDCT